jgi:hypothetical protein
MLSLSSPESTCRYFFKQPRENMILQPECNAWKRYDMINNAMQTHLACIRI